MSAVTRTPGVCGGAACLENTRMTLWTIYALLGQLPVGKERETIHEAYPHISDEQIDTAMKFIFSNALEMEFEIALNESAVSMPRTNNIEDEVPIRMRYLVTWQKLLRAAVKAELPEELRQRIATAFEEEIP